MHAPAPHPVRAHARVLTAALVGTAVEFYDFYIYATAAALVFGPLFFPAASAAAQTMFAFMSFGVAFVARPIGAIAFGHFGDRIGRKATLVASLMLMGGSTLAIAFLPTYAMVGWVAPALLCLMRFGQGFGLGGEWGGAALLAVENAPRGWEARFGAAPQLGAPVGFLAANGLFLVLGAVLSEGEFAAWGWRIPFLASAVLVGVGLWVRLRIGETAAFREALAHEAPVPVPLARLLAHHGGAVLAGSAGVVACFAIFYLATAFALAQGAGPLGYARESFLGVQLGANLFLALGILAAAAHADRTSPRRTLAIGASLAVAIGILFGGGLASGSLLLVFLTLAVSLFVMGLCYGPLGAWLPTLYPPLVRYSGISVAFNLGGIIGGALTPLVAQAMAGAGEVHFVGLLISAAGALTLAGLAAARPHRG
ncbi:MFS transporter [Novosphingobium bradum]|uniref:MFS transporter n=1 Tax=Novosphingobium bradum TaxID=1737444 RepID=A0ABV7IQE3_9SPHN